MSGSGEGKREASLPLSIVYFTGRVSLNSFIFYLLFYLLFFFSIRGEISIYFTIIILFFPITSKKIMKNQT